MKTKQLILLIAMMGVLFATAFAGDEESYRKKRSELMKERYTFFKENIKPIIDSKRNELEPSISSEDKKEIEQIREEVIKQKLLLNEFQFEAREARIKGEEFNEGLWQEIEAQHIVIENLYDKAKLIANRYRPEIDDMVADLRESIRDERSEQFEDRDEKFRGRTGRADREEFRGRGFERGVHPRMSRRFALHNAAGPGMGFPGPGFGEGMNIVAFILWNVDRG